MKRRLVCFIAMALLIGLSGIDISAAERSRSHRSSDRSRGKKSSRGKSKESHGKAKESRGKSARSTRGVRDERKLSRRERREMARSGGRNVARERVIVRGRHGRRY